MINNFLERVKSLSKRKTVILDASKMHRVQEYYACVSKVTKAIFCENQSNNDNFHPGSSDPLTILLTDERKKETPTAIVQGVFLKEKELEIEVEEGKFDLDNYVMADDQFQLSEYERALTNAIVSLIRSNENNTSKNTDTGTFGTVITTEQIYATLHGKRVDEVRPSKEALADLNQEIERLALLYLNIKLINLDKAYCLKDDDGTLIDHINIEGPFLHGDHVYVHFTMVKK